MPDLLTSNPGGILSTGTTSTVNSRVDLQRPVSDRPVSPLLDRFFLSFSAVQVCFCNISENPVIFMILSVNLADKVNELDAPQSSYLRKSACF